MFPESNSKRSCDFVGDNLVAGSVFDKGHMLKNIGSLNLIRTVLKGRLEKGRYQDGLYAVKA